MGYFSGVHLEMTLNGELNEPEPEFRDYPTDREIVESYINEHYCFGDLEAELGKTAAEICEFYECNGKWYINDHQDSGIEVVKVVDYRVVKI